MAGLLTHMSFALAGALILFFMFYKSKYRWFYTIFFFIGNLIPDLIDFGITGAKIHSLSPKLIMQDKLFTPLAVFGHSPLNWVFIVGAILILSIFLFKFKKISQKSLIAIIICFALFAIGITIHLNLDQLIQETHWWI